MLFAIFLICKVRSGILIDSARERMFTLLFQRIYPIDRRTAGVVADRISALGGIYPDDSDERLYALSYRVCSLCEKIMEEVQQEAVAS